MPDAFYITTPIYYVNGEPHIGHAYTTIAADVAARWQRLRGRDVRFLTGTDEHGQKVLDAAEARGMSPKEHCDDIVVRWKAMMAGLDIAYDRFIRTTDEDHEQVVRGVLQELHDAGEIYRDVYEGWYLVKDEVFVTEKEREERLASGANTEDHFRRIQESNWFFRMSKYQQALIAHIEAHPDFIQPTSRRNEVLGFLRQPLGDLCISRPKARMSWGIELPFDTDYVTYVWFDALLNYLTGTGYRPDGDDAYRKWWPADYHLIGKDILTTHSVYWTTMLLAMGVELPKHIYAHGWWQSSEGRKVGKSEGNAIDVDLLCESFGVDATRYFFLREIAFGADGTFSYDGFLTRYNADLANDLGNLAHRGLSMTAKWLGGRVPPRPESESGERELVALARETARTYAQELERLHFNRALEAVFDLVKAGNKYIDTTEPWALNKQGRMARLQTVKRHVLEVCYLAAVLLQPVMPRKAAELLGKLGRSEQQAGDYLLSVLEGERVLDGLEEGGALELGDPLFPRHREMPEAIAARFASVAETAPRTQPKPPDAKASAPKAGAGAKKQEAPRETIGFEDFQKVKLRVGQVIEARQHPNADKLLVLKVDVGEERPRNVVAGIRSRFAPDDLVGRKVVVVVNLAPAKLRGETSEAMLLAAGDREVIDLVSVDAPVGATVR